MISKNALKYFGVIIDVLSYTHTLPFKFDHKSNRLHAKKSQYDTKGVKAVICITVMYGIFSWFRLVSEIKSSLQDYIGLTIVGIWSLAYSWAMILQFCEWTKKDDMVWLFNQIIKLDSTYESKRLKNKEQQDSFDYLC
jgi:protein-S-isoprenylcysteine O-methyltransferase Ste14